MRRILLLSPVALLSACVVRAYDTRPAPVVYEPSAPGPVVVQPTYYQYNGPHPLPDSEGGGWCDIDGVHQHPFAPDDTSYQYVNQTYVWAQPRVVWYFGFHPIPGGGYCYLQGRHSHGYLPATEYRSNFQWSRGTRYYAYHGPYVAPGVHTVAYPPTYSQPGATVHTYTPPANTYHPYTPPPNNYHPAGPAYTPPPPGQVGGYTPGPAHLPPQNNPPPPPRNGGPYFPPGGTGPGSPPGGPGGGTTGGGGYHPPGAGNPPPGHGGPIPGHGGLPPGQGSGGPPGHQNNPGHGGYDPGPNPPGGGNGHGPHSPPPGHGHSVKILPGEKVPPGKHF